MTNQLLHDFTNYIEIVIQNIKTIDNNFRLKRYDEVETILNLINKLDPKTQSTIQSLKKNLKLNNDKLE